MTDNQKERIIETLTSLQAMHREQRRDYERGYLEGGIKGVEKALEILGYSVKFNPFDGTWTIIDRSSTKA